MTEHESASNAAPSAGSTDEAIKISPLLICLGVLAVLGGVVAGLVMSQATFLR